MNARASRSRPMARAWWLAALVAVPAVLGGLALLWPGPRIADDLRQRSEAALVSAGLDGVTVELSGRDVELARVPRESERAALDAVAAVPGVRAVRVGAMGEPPAAGAWPPLASLDERAAQRRELAEILAAAPVTFPADSAELSGPAAATVRRAAVVLVAGPTVRIEIEGHVADTPGSVEVGRRLSEQRATVVAEALVAAGVSRERITTRGRGAERPLATPAASRRVEIIVP